MDRADTRLEDTEEIYAALVTGTRDYVRKNGFDKVYLGLSGGIDSALTAVIAADAIGADGVTAVFMPTRYSSSESGRDAKELAENLGIHFRVLPIGEIFASYRDTLHETFAGLPEDPAAA